MNYGFDPPPQIFFATESRFVLSKCAYNSKQILKTGARNAQPPKRARASKIKYFFDIFCRLSSMVFIPKGATNKEYPSRPEVIYIFKTRL